MEKSGRVAGLIELDPKYADLIVRQREGWTGTGGSFNKPFGDGCNSGYKLPIGADFPASDCLHH
jgi:hypothetical protein